MAPRMQVDEILDRVSMVADMDKKISMMDEFMKRDPYLWELFKIAVTPSLKIPFLPEGFPKRYKPETGIPVGISDTNIRTEWRRIKNFLPNGSLKVLSPAQLESTWVALLQGVHWREAEILTWMKDQNLLEKYPDFWVILPALGIATCINTDAQPPETEEKSLQSDSESQPATPLKPEDQSPVVSTEEKPSEKPTKKSKKEKS